MYRTNCALTLPLQSAAQLSACSQLCVLSVAQNQLTSLDGLEGTLLTALLAVGAALHANARLSPPAITSKLPSVQF